MYASFRSVTAKNGKMLTPTRTGNFVVDLNGRGILRDGLAGRQWFVQNTRYAYRDFLHRFYIDLSCNQSWKVSLGQINQSSEKAERCATNYRDQNSVDSGHSSLRSVILRVRDQRRKWQATLPEYEVERQRKTNVLHASSCADFCLHINIYHLGTLEDFASFANAY